MGSTTYTNDALGARIGKDDGATWQYIYDGESRLTQVTKNGATQVDNTYDGNGMRVKKVESGKTTYFVYSGANPLMEYTPNDGSYMYRFYAGKSAIAEEKNGVVKFYHKDHLGSTRIVTNVSGIKTAEYKFAPYGEKEIASGDGTEYGFTGKTEDVSTGLKYFGARFYDAEVGRFLTADLYTNLPNDERLIFKIKDEDKALSTGFENPQRYNRFSYCVSNPLRYTDPNGKIAIVDDAIIIVVATFTVIAATYEIVAKPALENIGKAMDRATAEARSNTDNHERSISEKWSDFQQHRNDWVEVSERSVPSTNRNAKGGKSIERTYQNKKTSEKLYTHEVTKKDGKPAEKEHPREYEKGALDETSKEDDTDDTNDNG